MNTQRHGINIGLERVDDHIYMQLKVSGKLTHEDYELITPMLDEAVNGLDQPHINAFIDITELEGWELRAAWDDLKLGIKHGREFDRIAVVGNKPWEKYATKVANWFTGGEIEYFEHATEALQWLCHQ